LNRHLFQAVRKSFPTHCERPRFFRGSTLLLTLRFAFLPSFVFHAQMLASLTDSNSSAPITLDTILHANVQRSFAIERDG
jgi:hypothetical protein